MARRIFFEESSSLWTIILANQLDLHAEVFCLILQLLQTAIITSFSSTLPLQATQPIDFVTLLTPIIVAVIVRTVSNSISSVAASCPRSSATLKVNSPVLGVFTYFFSSEGYSSCTFSPLQDNQHEFPITLS